MSYDRRGGDRRGGSGEGGHADDDLHEAVLARYIADIAARLRTVLAHLSEEDFDKLVRDIALTKIRFEEIDAAPGASRVIRGEPGKGSPA